MIQEAAQFDEMVSVPISVFRQGEDGQLDTDHDRLAEAMMISLRGDAEAATSRARVAELQAEQARDRVVELTGEAVAYRARITGLERTKAELEARILAAGENETDARTLEHMGGMLVAEQDKARALADRLEVAEALAAKATERGEQLADLQARYQHDQERLERQDRALKLHQRDLLATTSKLNELEAIERDLRLELRRVTDSLALADKAKINAVAAAEMRVREQLAHQPAQVPEGMALISAAELAALRAQSAEADGLREHNKVIAGELARINAQVIEQEGTIEQACRDLDYASLELELYAVTIKEQAHMIKDQGRSLHYANMMINMVHGRNNLPDFSRDEGHVTVFSLSSECLLDAGDAPIDTTKPLMWWTGRDGAGCMIALSEQPDERGRQVLVMPVLHMERDGQRINFTDEVAPPEFLRDEIADYIKSIDLPAIEQVMKESAEIATRKAYEVEPLLRTSVADIKRLQARRNAIKNSQAAIRRESEKALRLTTKKFAKAARQAAQKGH